MSDPAAPARRPPQRDRAGSPPASHHGAGAARMELRPTRPQGRRGQGAGHHGLGSRTAARRSAPRGFNLPATL
jgi:hypothetical protein